MTNPYNCTIPGNLFVGREEIRRELVTGFQNGNSYAILGGRRCGKTSLLIQVKKDLENKRLGPYTPIPIYFSVQGLGMVTPAMLFEEIYDSVARKTENPPAWETPEPGREYYCLLKHLDHIAPNLMETHGPDWLAILLVDELDAAIAHLKDDQFFQNLRNFLMESRFNRNFRLAATGVKNLAGLITSGSPLNNLRHEYLGVLDSKAALQLVRAGFPDIGEHSETVKTILGLTGGHPYLLQGILENIWPDLPTNETIQKASVKFLRQHGDFKNWLINFGPAEKGVFRLLAQSPNGEMDIRDIARNMDDSLRTETEDAVTVLSYHGVIDDSDPDKPKIAGSMFKDWFFKQNPAIEAATSGKENETTMQVFISHAKEDLGTATKLYNDLKKAGIKPWMVSQDLIHGQEAPAMIRGAIKESSYFLALLSENSVSKQGYVHKELKIAMDILDELPQSGIFIIPVRLDDCKIYDETLDKLYPVNLHHSYETGLKQILRATGKSGGNQSASDTRPASDVSKPSSAVFGASEKIKILFLGANPTDNVRLRLDEEIRGIDQALRNAQFRDRFVFEKQMAVRVADLQGHLLRHDPEIVHFSGHGSKHSEIILEDNAGNSQPVPAPALGKLFSVLKGNIRCVVLNACFSADQAKSIGEHIDYVVGMSAAIGDRAAISFASSFYQGLGFGRDIKTAFDLGCVQIALEGIDEADTPQLLIR